MSWFRICHILHLPMGLSKNSYDDETKHMPIEEIWFWRTLFKYVQDSHFFIWCEEWSFRMCCITALLLNYFFGKYMESITIFSIFGQILILFAFYYLVGVQFCASLFMTRKLPCTLSSCRQLSVWMVMAAKFEVDLQQWKQIQTLTHQLLVIHVIYGMSNMLCQA